MTRFCANFHKELFAGVKITSKPPIHHCLRCACDTGNGFVVAALIVHRRHLGKNISNFSHGYVWYAGTEQPVVLYSQQMGPRNARDYKSECVNWEKKHALPARNECIYRQLA